MKIELMRDWAYAPAPGVTCRYKPGVYEIGKDAPLDHLEGAIARGIAKEIKEAPAVETKARKRRVRKSS